MDWSTPSYLKEDRCHDTAPSLIRSFVQCYSIYLSLTEVQHVKLQHPFILKRGARLHHISIFERGEAPCHTLIINRAAVPRCTSILNRGAVPRRTFNLERGSLLRCLYVVYRGPMLRPFLALERRVALWCAPPPSREQQYQNVTQC